VPRPISRRAFAEQLALAAAAPFVALDLPAGTAPRPSPPQGAQDTEPSPLYGDRLSDDDLRAITQAIHSRLQNVDQLYKVALTNADEPAFVFAAYRGTER